MRTVRDMDLALVDGIDLILAGHDHNYEIHENNNVKIVKSGTDFNDLSEVTLHFDVSLEEAMAAEENMKDTDFCCYKNGIFT